MKVLVILFAFVATYNCVLTSSIPNIGEIKSQISDQVENVRKVRQLGGFAQQYSPYQQQQYPQQYQQQQYNPYQQQQYPQQYQQQQYNPYQQQQYPQQYQQQYGEHDHDHGHHHHHHHHDD